MTTKHLTSTLLILIPVGLLSGLLGGFVAVTYREPSSADLVREFYRTENAVHVSPHGLRKKIAERASDFVLVDLRSAEEYEREHIVGAVSIPAYRDKDHAAYDEVDRIVAAFQALPPGKSIIVYCYSMACMTGRKVGQMLAEKGIYVQHLGIGWNEWRHFWTLWNHEHEWASTKPEQFVAAGKEPGAYSGPLQITPCTEGQFGC